MTKNPGRKDRKQSVTLGGGCFWCLEAVYNEIEGVDTVVSGYAGGHVNSPSYQMVSSGVTGHVEVVQITFDSKVISLKEIVEIFFSVHDPTTLNRQGADTGTQYRSVILYRSEMQKRTAEAVILSITENNLWNDPIVTEVKPLGAFYEAEDYHQKYLENNPTQPYCLVIVQPKLSKFRKQFPSKLKRRPVS